ncbi:MAG: PhoH family protein, partial [Lachnospiraceae bacterium]|nr:PhoH family protein [Lachnospiraceae bacterium]
KVVITGDATQKDLMPQVRSGLDVARVILKDIDDIAFCELTGKDVVRHPLVQKIVQAYEDYEKKHNAAHRKNGDRSSSRHGK